MVKIYDTVYAQALFLFRTFALFATPYIEGYFCMYLIFGCAVKKSD